MNKIICIKIDDSYLLIDKNQHRTLKIPEKLYNFITFLIKTNGIIPNIIQNFFHQSFEIKCCSTFAKDLFIIKNNTNYFLSASYEITNKCNFRCLHCYLREKKSDEINFNFKENVIQFINNIGCLWLQITGGEPLLSKDFEKIYSLAYKLNILLMISTNGSLISQYKDLFTKYPPYKLSISLYGSNSETYKKVTGRDYFVDVVKGFDFLKSINTRVGINIIVLEHNYLETNEMKKIAKEYSFKYHIYNKISPAIPHSIQKQCDTEYRNFPLSDPNKNLFNCYAGKKFFNIDSMGNISICKIARNFNISIFKKTPNKILEKLYQNTNILLQKSQECLTCKNFNCNTCPPILELYKKTGDVPLYICERR